MEGENVKEGEQKVVQGGHTWEWGNQGGFCGPYVMIFLGWFGNNLDGNVRSKIASGNFDNSPSS